MAKRADDGAAATARSGGRRERGFALLLVMWVIGLLAVLAAAVAAESHSEALVARHGADLAEARAVADSGITLAVTGLFDADPNARWHADGSPHDLRYGGGTVTVRVLDEGGKIDLNNAPIELIAGLLDEFGVDADRRTAITNAIADRRNAFSASGAKTMVPGRFYPNAATATTVNYEQLAFADISELRLMPGMTRALYEQVRPYLTTYSASGTINPMTAARETLLAVPGMAAQDVDFFLAARANATQVAPPQLPPGVDRYVRPADLRVATITADAKLGSRATFTREAVVDVSPDLPQEPIRFLQWRQPIAASAVEDVSLR